MAEKIREYVNDQGHTIAVYASGAEYDVTAGHLVKAPEHSRITRENSTEMRRKYKEKTARLLRQSITVETADKLLMSQKPSAPEAVAAAGGILWREIVLNGDAYPRDRLEAWQKLGQHAQVIGDPKDSAPESETISPNALGQAAAAAVIALAERLNGSLNYSYRKHSDDSSQVVDGAIVPPSLPRTQDADQAEPHAEHEDEEDL